jgi:hypothetical protein
MSWQTETGRISCRWSDLGEHVKYSAPWIQDSSTNVDNPNVSASVLDFTRLSPFGENEWYDPDCLRL